MNFSQKIKATRQQRGMSQAGLARVSGLSRAVISKWEKRSVNPSARAVEQVADALNVSTHWLLKDRPP